MNARGVQVDITTLAVDAIVNAARAQERPRASGHRRINCVRGRS